MGYGNWKPILPTLSEGRWKREDVKKRVFHIYIIEEKINNKYFFTYTCVSKNRLRFNLLKGISSILLGIF